MNRKTIFSLFALSVVAFLLLAACGGGSTSQGGASSNAVAEGKNLFQQTCAACHGPDAKGLPNLGKDLTTSEFAKSKTDAELLEFIKAGRPANDPLNTTGIDMPPKGGNPALTDDNILAIIAYIRTLQK